MSDSWFHGESDLEELMTETWATDELLASAAQRYSSGIPGFVMPVAYSVGRLDGKTVTGERSVTFTDPS